MILTTHRADTIPIIGRAGIAFAALESLRARRLDWRSSHADLRAFWCTCGVCRRRTATTHEKAGAPADLLLPFPARRWTSMGFG
jgi:hypothetical protein